MKSNNRTNSPEDLKAMDRQQHQHRAMMSPGRKSGPTATHAESGSLFDRPDVADQVRIHLGQRRWTVGITAGPLTHPDTGEQRYEHLLDVSRRELLIAGDLTPTQRLKAWRHALGLAAESNHSGIRDLVPTDQFTAWIVAEVLEAESEGDLDSVQAMLDRFAGSDTTRVDVSVSDAGGVTDGDNGVPKSPEARLARALHLLRRMDEIESEIHALQQTPEELRELAESAARDLARVVGDSSSDHQGKEAA